MVQDSPTPYLLGSVREVVKAYGLSALIASAILLIIPQFVSYILLYYLGGILFLLPILAPVVSKWIPKVKVSPSGKAVFITGCDSGFGFLLAQRLDDLGFHVFAGCLFPDGDGATQLRKSGSDRLHVISIDVTSNTSVESAATYVKDNLTDDLALWAVVNNAGINEGGELHWTDVKTIQRVVDVNTIGAVRVTKAFLSNLKESKGRIVTVASAAGRVTFPGMVPYCMSKGAAIAFCDGLRLEMYKWNIPVVTIEPWMYRTPILNEERNVANLRDTWAKAPKDVKDMYSPNYIEKYIKRFLRVPTVYAKSDPTEVVSLMEDGVTLLHPEYSYPTGSLLSRLTGWVLVKLPKPIADYLMFRAMAGKSLR